MDEIPDRAPAECPNCGEFFDPRDEGVEISVTDEGESQVTCPNCGARFHLDAEPESSDLGEAEL